MEEKMVVGRNLKALREANGYTQEQVDVDMAAKEPIESALKLFGELLDEMEEML